jgi:hypothetical protein
MRNRGARAQAGSTADIEYPGFDRVRARSSASATREIDLATEARVSRLRRAGPVEAGRRLGELDREWDIDRALMLLFSGLGGLTFSLGVRRTRPWKTRGNGWLYVFSTQLAFLGIHAAYGWCPPIALLRRLGFRTQKEIQAERNAVDALTNDLGPDLPNQSLLEPSARTDSIG